ncbi:MAG TPA: hypothetical protein VFO91_19815 [Anaerolineales bacterium]|nr:hypothetical protein [Anaerolineales bacterium]
MERISLDNKLISERLQPDDPAYTRCYQRLKEDLELDNEALEVILHLRNQVTVLQTRLRRLESTLEIYQLRSGARLTRYREVLQDADWEDI